MNSQEIAELAMWTARAIYDAFKAEGVNLPATDENLIATFVQRMLEDWQRGIIVDEKHMLALAGEFEKNNKKLSPEVMHVLKVFVAKFPEFVAENSNAVKV